MSRAIGESFGLIADYDSLSPEYWDAGYRKFNELQLGFKEREPKNQEKALGAMYYCLARKSILMGDKMHSRLWLNFILYQLRVVFPAYMRRDMDVERKKLQVMMGVS